MKSETLGTSFGIAEVERGSLKNLPRAAILATATAAAAAAAAAGAI